ncbi:MAG: peroxiredoxin-like family protein [Acidobacteriota bacterium]
MFCREQVAQLRDVVPQIREKGAELIVIGNGTPDQAKAFAEERDLDFPLLTDPGRRTYKAAGFRRDIKSTFNLGILKNAKKTLSSGHRQGKVEGDPWQQGGAFVIAPGDEVLFRYVSGAAGDHPDPRDLVASLPG